MTKIPILQPLKAGTKIVEGSGQIDIDIILTLDREDYAFFKEMYELDIDVRGRIVDLTTNRVLGYFSNAVRSIDSNVRALE